ncbi:hypothetical protein L0244_15105 [bacterium]|nr:hypothetical protein [bacterium]
MVANDKLDELQKYIILFESFLGRFVHGGSPYGPSLNAEDEAQVKRVTMEVVDFLKDVFGKKNSYSHNIINTINAQATNGGLSYDSVREVIGILQSAAIKLKRKHVKKEMKVRSETSSSSSAKRAMNKSHDVNVIEVGKQDVGKIPISDLIRMLNSGQVKAVIVTLIALLVGSFWLGNYYRSLLSEKETLNIAAENAELKKQVQDLKSATEESSGNPSEHVQLVWEGTWQTETPLFANVRIQFTQVNDNISGSYKYVSKNAKEEIEGRIEAKLSGNVLDGKWIEYHGNSKFEGFVYFIMSFDGRSFTGRYTRYWEGDQGEYVWKGIKVN